MVDPMSKRVKVYQRKYIFCGMERVKSCKYNFVVEYPSVFHIGKSVL